MGLTGRSGGHLLLGRALPPPQSGISDAWPAVRSIAQLPLATTGLQVRVGGSTRHWGWGGWCVPPWALLCPASPPTPSGAREAGISVQP